jgi:excisionase family DNA binding protein
VTNELLLTVEQAAERLNLGRTFVYGLVRRGELASVKAGRARRVPVQAVDQYIERLLEEQVPRRRDEPLRRRLGPRAEAGEDELSG